MRQGCNGKVPSDHCNFPLYIFLSKLFLFPHMTCLFVRDTRRRHGRRTGNPSSLLGDFGKERPLGEERERNKRQISSNNCNRGRERVESLLSFLNHCS